MIRQLMATNRNLEANGQARKRLDLRLWVARLTVLCYLLIACTNPYMHRDLQPIIDARNPDLPDPPVTYTVTFDSMGGSEVPSQTVKEGGFVIEPIARPTRIDHGFDGWYKEAECINIWNFTVDTVTEDITLYARWVEESAAAVTISVEQIIDGDIPNFNITVSRTGSGGVSSTAYVSVDPADYDAGSIRWEIAGAGAYAGELVSGTGAGFTIDAADVRYNTVGGHSLVIEVRIEGILYRRNILFTITN